MSQENESSIAPIQRIAHAIQHTAITEYNILLNEDQLGFVLTAYLQRISDWLTVRNSIEGPQPEPDSIEDEARRTVDSAGKHLDHYLHELLTGISETKEASSKYNYI